MDSGHSGEYSEYGYRCCNAARKRYQSNWFQLRHQ